MLLRQTAGYCVAHAAGLCVAVGVGAASAAAGTYTPLYTFSGGTDGGVPIAGVVRDAAGNLYGENESGADACLTNPPNPGDSGCGVVFKISPSGHETTLVTFNGTNGDTAISPLTLVGTTLYGTTYGGGASDLGVVFSVHTDGSGFAVLHQFSGTDGAHPAGALQPGPGGVLYGVTGEGGPGYGSDVGYGVLYQLNPDGSYVHLHDFAYGADNAFPTSILINSAGVIFGAAGSNGELGCYKAAHGKSCGVIFEYAPASSAFSVLHTFSAADYYHEPSPLLGSMGPDGTLYGVTVRDGSNGAGTLFSLPKTGATFGFDLLWNFDPATGAAYPSGGPVVTPSGAIAGVTAQGAKPNTDLGAIYAFQNGTLTTLYSFGNDFSTTGSNPSGTLLIVKSSGSVIGVANGGGTLPCPGLGQGFESEGCGVVYSFKP